mgnify:CR=1 FL=1
MERDNVRGMQLNAGVGNVKVVLAGVAGSSGGAATASVVHP